MDDVAAPTPSGNPGCVVPSPKENPRFDPYAFSTDDQTVQTPENTGRYQSNISLQLSVHPKTFLPPGNPSSIVKIPVEKGLEPHQNHLSAYLHSPTQGAYPAAQTGQHFTHPSSKSQNESVILTMDKMHLLNQTKLQAISTVEKQSSPCQTTLSQQTNWQPQKPKKKAKQKATEGGEGTKKKSKKPPKPKEAATLTPDPMLGFPLLNSVTSPASHKSLPQHALRVEPKLPCSKNSATSLPMGMPKDGSNAFLHNFHPPGSFTTTTQSLPTTTTATTFTNSIRFYPDDRRQFPDSVEQPSSRPASRTSTTSSTSSNTEGKSKESSDSISMSKILEIIERERSLGSSSPCKRRRTAKPQHIQEAEEEAKKYAATNAAQSMKSGVSPASDSHNADSQDSVKKSEHTKSSLMDRQVPDILPQNKTGEQSKGSCQPCSPNIQVLSQRSNDSSESLSRQSFSPFPVIYTDVGAADKSNTPAFHKLTPPLHLQSVSSSSNVRADASLFVSSEPSKFPGKKTPTKNQIVNTISKDTPINNSAVTNQNSPHKPPNKGVSRALCKTSKVNSNLFTTPPQNVTPHSPQGTGIPGMPAMTLPVSSSPAPPPKGNFQQFNVSNTTLEEKILNDLSSSHVPVSVAAASGGSDLSQLQSTIQSLFHGSSTQAATAQWVNGTLDGSLPNMVSSSTVPDSLMDVKVQDLEPSLTCDLNNAWSQTTNMISGIDAPQQALQNQTNSVTLPKKPKKKRPPVKPKTSQSSSLTTGNSSLSVSTSSSGSLPPFGAFAGLKMETALPAFELMSTVAQTQQSNSQGIPSTQNTGIKSPTNKKKVKKPTLNLTEMPQSTDRKPIIKGSTALQEPLRDNSNLKSVGTGDKSNFLVSDDSCKTVKTVVGANTQTYRSVVYGLPNAKQTKGSNSLILSSEKVEPNNSKMYSDGFPDVKPGSNGVIPQKMLPPANSVLANNIQMNSSPMNNNSVNSTHINSTPFNNTPITNPPVSSTPINNTPINNIKPGNTGGNIPINNAKPGNTVGNVVKQFTGDNSTMKVGLNGFNFNAVTLDDNSSRMQMRPESIADQGWDQKPAMDPYTVKQGYEATASMKPAGGSGPFSNKQKPALDPFTVKQGYGDTAGLKPAVGNISPLSNLGQGLQKADGLSSVSGNGLDAKSRPTLLLNGAQSPSNISGGIPGIGHQSTPLPHPPSQAPKVESTFAQMSPEEELDDRLRNNKVETPPKCSCLGPNYEYNESIEGPYYTQLGAAKDMAAVRRIMEARTGVSGNAIRLEKIHYTGKEGRSSEGCPIAKWIIRRSGPEEKYLCVARKRPGHFCDTAYIIVVIVAWDGVLSQQADSLYGYLVSSLTKNGFETERRCGLNERKTCACQGVDLIRRGASFSFGCSWSMYYNRCKFARSHIARKFKLKDTNEEEKMEEHLQDLATEVGPLYKVLAPEAYRNQTFFEEQAGMCRIGNEKGKPFSGVTACVDFCAHSHKDFHNMQNGSTVVVTLTKHRGWSKPDDEQLHVLPLYVLDNTDEHGSIDGQMKKVQAGALEILHKYSHQARLRATPLKKPKRGAKKESPAKTSIGVNATVGGGGSSPSTPDTPTPPTTPNHEKDMSFLHCQDSSQSLPDNFLPGSRSNSTTPTPDGKRDNSGSFFVDKENSSASDDFMSQSFGPSEMYEKVWEYFDSNGAFPPQSYMDRWAAAQKQAMMNSHPQTTAPTTTTTTMDNNGATTTTNHQGSSNLNNNSHQTFSSHHPNPLLEAATDSSSPNHSSLSGASTPHHPHHNNNAGPEPRSTPGIKTEAASSSSDIDLEIMGFAHTHDHSDSNSRSSPSPSKHAGVEGNSLMSSGAQTPVSRPPSANADGIRTPGGSQYASPLDLLREAANSMQAGLMEGGGGAMSPSCSSHFASSPLNNSANPRSSVPPLSPMIPSPNSELMSPTLPRPHSSPGVVHNSTNTQQMHPSLFASPKSNCDGTSAPPPLCNDSQSSSSSSTQSKPVMHQQQNPQQEQSSGGPFVTPTLGQGPDEPTFTMIDPTVVRCEWQDNMENFHDPGIGGVAIALTHGAVLFEVAKRELHATTALKNPNRYQPTRISLVFYQHKNLNYYHHGYYDYERRLATQRKKRIEKLMEEGATEEEAEKAVKPGRKRKKKEVAGGGREEDEDGGEKVDFAKTSAAQYKYMWDTTVRHGMTLTTDSIITRWIDPQPMVTGPYQRWV